MLDQNLDKARAVERLEQFLDEVQNQITKYISSYKWKSPHEKAVELNGKIANWRKDISVNNVYDRVDDIVATLKSMESLPGRGYMSSVAAFSTEIIQPLLNNQHLKSLLEVREQAEDKAVVVSVNAGGINLGQQIINEDYVNFEHLNDENHARALNEIILAHIKDGDLDGLDALYQEYNRKGKGELFDQAMLVTNKYNFNVFHISAQYEHTPILDWIVDTYQSRAEPKDIETLEEAELQLDVLGRLLDQKNYYGLTPLDYIFNSKIPNEKKEGYRNLAKELGCNAKVQITTEGQIEENMLYSDVKRKGELDQTRMSSMEKAFSSFEQMVDLSYLIPRANIGHGETVAVLNKEGKFVEHEVKRVETKHSDLIPVILIPKQSETLPVEIKVLCQGTVSGAGWGRNFTGIGGAGYDSFKDSEAMIVEQLAWEMNKFKEQGIPVKLSFIGHSLGGSDAQNTMVSVMEAMERHDISNVTELELAVFNSAGVPDAVAQRSKELATSLKKKGVGIEANFSVIGGDAVQQTGDATILADLDPSIAKVNVAKTKTKYEGTWVYSLDLVSAGRAAYGTYKAHTKRWFNEHHTKKEGVVFYNNESEAGRAHIEKALRKIAKTHPRTYQAATYGKKGLQAVQAASSYWSTASKGEKEKEKEGTTADVGTSRPAVTIMTEITESKKGTKKRI